MPIWAVLLVVIVVALVLGLVGAAFLAPARVSFELDGGVLVIGLGAADRLLCLHGPIRLPLAQIRSVRVVGRDEVSRPVLRFPGSYIPGVITAGSYGLGAERSFWDVRKASRVLVIACQPDAAYSSLVLEVPDPDEAAARLAHSVGQR